MSTVLDQILSTIDRSPYRTTMTLDGKGLTIRTTDGAGLQVEKIITPKQIGQVDDRGLFLGVRNAVDENADEIMAVHKRRRERLEV